MSNNVDRDYTEKQCRTFESKFKKEYPEVFKAIKENTQIGGMSPIIFALYESEIFDQVMN